MALIDKNLLVDYLITKHDIDYKKKISPLKIQKSLYFLYAFYAGKVSLLNSALDEEDMKEVNLFDANFEAWAYGPVDRDVYDRFKIDSFNNNFDCNNFLGELDEFTRGYLEDMTDRIFSTSDFSLVDLSHEDTSWKNNFDRKDPRASKKISNKDIIKEYHNYELC